MLTHEEEPLKIQNQKIFSTQQSKNSSGTVHKFTDRQPDLDNSSMKLFTFMNCFQDERPSIPNMRKTNKHKNKCIKQANKENNLKRKNSCLKEIIEQSRKKRQNFLNTLIDIDLKDKPIRKSKTPKHSLKMDELNLCERKSKTPRAISNSKGQVKLFRAKSSLGQIKNKEIRQQNNEKAQEKKVMEELSKRELLKKKQALEKQLLQINSSLFLKKKNTKKLKNCNLKSKKK